MIGSADTTEAAKAMVRRWAGGRGAAIPEARSGRSSEAGHGELVRLRALIELGADALDAAGDEGTASQLRRAAFPERFKGGER